MCDFVFSKNEGGNAFGGFPRRAERKGKKKEGGQFHTLNPQLPMRLQVFFWGKRGKEKKERGGGGRPAKRVFCLPLVRENPAETTEKGKEGKSSLSAVCKIILYDSPHPWAPGGRGGKKGKKKRGKGGECCRKGFSVSGTAPRRTYDPEAYGAVVWSLKNRREKKKKKRKKGREGSSTEAKKAPNNSLRGATFVGGGGKERGKRPPRR